jgi:hypothetical protein
MVPGKQHPAKAGESEVDMDERNFNVGVNSRTPQTIGFTAAYHAEHNAWRRRRGQWATLCKLIRSEAPKAGLYAAASEAGCHLNELWDMMTLARRARDSRDEAAKLDGAEKTLLACQKRLEKAQKTLDRAGLSMNAQADAEVELEAAVLAFDRANMAAISMRQAAQCVALAKSENLI